MHFINAFVALLATTAIRMERMENFPSPRRIETLLFPRRCPVVPQQNLCSSSLATCHQATFCNRGLILLSLEFNIQLDLSISASFSASDSANFSSKTFKKLHLSWTCTHIFHCHYSLKDPTIYITCTSTIYITCTLYQGLWVI